jgi:site-specific recombinase XerD
MLSMSNKDFSYHLTKYFTDFLPNQKNAAANTISSYRDTFVLLLGFFKEVYRIPPENLTYESFTVERIEAFLNWLETERNAGIKTRNQRLAAIHAFFRYIQYRDPAGFEQTSRILTIQYKKVPQAPAVYMSLDEISYLFSIPDKNDKKQFRDWMIMVLLYESGARIQELLDLTPTHIHWGNTATLELHGKGNKSRITPINHTVRTMLKRYLQIYPRKENDFLFTNRKGEKLSRAGVQYIIDKYTSMAHNQDPQMFRKRITNHSFRHSKAMHLLEAGVNLVYIRDFLGHSSVITTEQYARANPKIKEEQLKKGCAAITAKEKYSKDDKADLINWLKENL